MARDPGIQFAKGLVSEPEKMASDLISDLLAQLKTKPVEGQPQWVQTIYPYRGNPPTQIQYQATLDEANLMIERRSVPRAQVSYRFHVTQNDQSVASANPRHAASPIIALFDAIHAGHADRERAAMARMVAHLRGRPTARAVADPDFGPDDIDVAAALVVADPLVIARLDWRARGSAGISLRFESCSIDLVHGSTGVQLEVSPASNNRGRRPTRLPDSTAALVSAARTVAEKRRLDGIGRLRHEIRTGRDAGLDI